MLLAMRASRGVRLLSTKGKADAPESSFPFLPAIAVALSAPIAAFKLGFVSLDQLPENVTAALPEFVVKYVLTAVPPPSGSAAPLVPAPPSLPPAQPAALPAILSPGSVAGFLEANKAQIAALLWRDLSAVRAQESWLRTFTQPLTSRELGRQRRAIEEQLKLRDAH